jgi:single-strand DNA-binding protein
MNYARSVGKMSLNLFIASGNLGNDIDVRFTPNGKCIGQFSLPVTSGWGENEKTTWVKCKVLGDRAEKLQPYLVKGSLVTVNGRFEMDEWEKDGVKHSQPVVIVNDLVLPPKDNSKIIPPRQQASPNRQLTQEEIEALNDDVPF